MKYQALITAAGLALASLAGCGEDAPEAEFTFISGSAHNRLDPQQMSWLLDLRIAGQLYSPLVDYDFEADQAEPATARSWEVSDDRRTYTFHLREDAKWSNGDPVTAQDYAYAWRRALLPSFSASYTTLMFRIQGAKDFNAWRVDQLAQFSEILDEAGSQSGREAAEETWQLAKDRFAETVGISAPDERTLKVTLEQPVPYFLQLVAFPTFSPVHRSSVKEATTINASTGRLEMDSSYWTDPDRLVTNGPYRIAARKFKRYVYLEANQHYYAREEMKNDSVLERIISDVNNRVLTYNDGQADWLPAIPAQSPVAVDLVKQDRDDVHKYPTAGTYFYNFNCDPDYTLPNGNQNPLVDKKVRRAFAMAIDRERIVKRVTQLNQPTARTYVPPKAVDGYDPPVEAGITFDPERAKQLLAEAGHPNGEGLDGLTILYNTDSGHGRIAQEVQRMWKRHLGVSVELNGIQLTTFAERLDNGNFSIARASWIGDYEDPTTWLTKMSSDSNNNDANWSNEEYDRLLEEAATQRGEARMQTLREAERVLIEEQPLALMYFTVNIDLFDPKRVEGLGTSPWPHRQLEEVRVEDGGGSATSSG